MDIKNYTVLSPVRHAGKTYPVGSTISCDEGTATVLQGLKVIGEAHADGEVKNPKPDAPPGKGKK